MHNLSAQKICVWVYEICIHDRTLVVSIVWRTCHIENVEYATERQRIQSFNVTARKSYIKVCWPTLVRPVPLLVYVLLDHNSGSCGQSRPLAPVYLTQQTPNQSIGGAFGLLFFGILKCTCRKKCMSATVVASLIASARHTPIRSPILFAQLFSSHIVFLPESRFTWRLKSHQRLELGWFLRVAYLLS